MFNAGKKSSTSASVLTTWQNQAAWFLDCANSGGNANDANDGATSLTPLLHIQELERRRALVAASANNGGEFPITQNTTITMMSLPPAAANDLILTTPLRRFGAFQLSYIFASTTTRTGTIAAVTARSATQWWQIGSDMIAGDSGGKLILDTTAHACAWTKDVAAGLADTTEWTATQAGPIVAGTPPAGPVSPVVGDAYAVQALCVVKFGRVKITQQGSPLSPNLSRPAVLFYRFDLAGDLTGAFGVPDATYFDSDLSGSGLGACGLGFTECAFRGMTFWRAGTYYFHNCFFASTQFWTPLTSSYAFSGSSAGIFPNGANLHFDLYHLQALDALFGFGIGDNGGGTLPGQISLGRVMLYKQTSGAAYFSTAGTAYLLSASTGSIANVAIAGQCTRMFRISNGSKVLKTSGVTWVAACPATCVSTFADIDGQSSPTPNAVSFDTASLARGTTAIAVTPAQLDATIAGGGFGGFAINPGTGTRFAPYLT